MIPEPSPSESRELEKLRIHAAKHVSVLASEVYANLTVGHKVPPHDFGKPELNEDGTVNTLPLYCRGCNRTTWYQPNAMVSRCCSEMNTDRDWWKAMWTEAYERGKAAHEEETT